MGVDKPPSSVATEEPAVWEHGDIPSVCHVLLAAGAIASVRHDQVGGVVGHKIAAVCAAETLDCVANLLACAALESCFRTGDDVQ